MIPWERRQEIGFLTAVIETTKEVLLTETGESGFFRRMPVSGGIGSPLLYAVVIGYVGILVSAIYSAVFLVIRGAVRGAAFSPFADRPELARFVEAFESWGGILSQVVLGPIAIVIWLFVWAATVHLILLVFGGARGGFEATFRVLGYIHAANVFAIIPVCGSPLAFLYGVVLSIIGLAEAQQVPVWKTMLAVFLPPVLCCCCCVAGIVTMAGGLASLISHAR